LSAESPSAAETATASAAASAVELVSEGPALLTLEGNVALLTLNRPDAANGLDMEMLEGVRACLRRCHDARVRVVVLTGRGAHFCAGGDVHAFAAQGADLPYYIRRATSLLQEVIVALIRLDAPVIAAVQGYAAGGGGLGLVCACDLVFAAQSAKFLAGATRVGMAPDAGLSVTLPRLVGARKAAEFLLGNPTWTAPEALAHGLINHVVADAALTDAVRTYAEKLERGAPLALAATKRLLWSGVGLGVEAAMPEESRTVSELCRSADVHEGLAAVIAKRAPRFEGR
jgi:2-(1,2-epoxy-1,2-dihydrophenyl)acetyl-CoA isomerase